MLVVLLSLTAVSGTVRLGGDPVLLFLPIRPLVMPYARFMRGALYGDFCQSLRYRRESVGNTSTLRQRVTSRMVAGPLT